MTVEELDAKLREAVKEIDSLDFAVRALQAENDRLREENRRLREGDQPIIIPSYANPFACGD